MSGKVALNARRGHHKQLDSVEETNLLSFLIKCGKLGCAHTRKKATTVTQEVVNEKGIKANITTSWWKSFASRHRKLSLREIECVFRARTIRTNEVALEKYFDLLCQTLFKEGLQECPYQYFHLDETGIPLDPPPPKVVAKKGQKHPTSLTRLVTQTFCLERKGLVYHAYCSCLFPLHSWENHYLINRYLSKPQLFT